MLTSVPWGATPVKAKGQRQFFKPPRAPLAALLQERMANNHVYVFRKSQPSKYAYVAECRCDVATI